MPSLRHQLPRGCPGGSHFLSLADGYLGDCHYPHTELAVSWDDSQNWAKHFTCNHHHFITKQQPTKEAEGKVGEVRGLSLPSLQSHCLPRSPSPTCTKAEVSQIHHPEFYGGGRGSLLLDMIRTSAVGDETPSLVL